MRYRTAFAVVLLATLLVLLDALVVAHVWHSLDGPPTDDCAGEVSCLAVASLDRGGEQHVIGQALRWPQESESTIFVPVRER